MLDQFIAEGVLISDSSCDVASSLVIVNKIDEGIRMAVDYQEVNMQLEATENQLQLYFKRLGDNVFMLKWTIFGVIISCASLKIDNSKVTTIITPWWCIDFWCAHLVYRLHLVSIKLA